MCVGVCVCETWRQIENKTKGRKIQTRKSERERKRKQKKINSFCVFVFSEKYICISFVHWNTIHCARVLIGPSLQCPFVSREIAGKNLLVFFWSRNKIFTRKWKELQPCENERGIHSERNTERERERKRGNHGEYVRYDCYARRPLYNRPLWSTNGKSFAFYFLFLSRIFRSFSFNIFEYFSQFLLCRVELYW